MTAQRILLVEDDAILGRSLQRVLQRGGFEVEWASSAEDGLSVHSSRPFAALLLDVNLPGISGVDMLRQLRGANTDIPVLLMSGNPNLETAMGAVELGADQFIQKPVAPNKLIEVIEKAIKRRSERLRVPTRYRVISKIASGGMGTVYLGCARGAQGFRRYVAIKKAHPHLVEDAEFRAMLVSEARIASQLHHPNVVAVSDVEDSADGIQLIMDYVEGVSLAQLLGSDSPPSVEQAISMMIDLAEGLDSVHGTVTADGSRGLVHRDVSPQNALIGTDGVARLTDFGIARAHEASNRTASGLLRGKPGYMAPEYITSAIVDHKTDIFALGIVAWEALTHQRLFRGVSELDTIDRVRSMPIPAPSSKNPMVPATIDAIILKALSRAPGLRYARAADFAADLTRAARESALFAARSEIGAYVYEFAKADIDTRRAAITVSEAPAAPPSNSEMAAAPVASNRVLALVESEIFQDPHGTALTRVGDSLLEVGPQGRGADRANAVAVAATDDKNTRVVNDGGPSTGITDRKQSNVQQSDAVHNDPTRVVQVRAPREKTVPYVAPAKSPLPTTPEAHRGTPNTVNVGRGSRPESAHATGAAVASLALNNPFSVSTSTNVVPRSALLSVQSTKRAREMLTWSLAGFFGLLSVAGLMVIAMLTRETTSHAHETSAATGPRSSEPAMTAKSSPPRASASSATEAPRAESPAVSAPNLNVGAPQTAEQR